MGSAVSDRTLADLQAMTPMGRSGKAEEVAAVVAFASLGHAAFTASVELHELATEQGDLEQVFLQLTAGKAGIR